MFMSLIARGVAAVGGPWIMGLIVYPIIGIAALTGAHVIIEGYKGKLRAEGEAKCNIEWEQKIRGEERRSAQIEIDQARSMLEVERKNTGGLNDRIKTLTEDMEALRLENAAFDDSKCLSDSVLQRLGKSSGRAKGVGASGPGAGAEKGAAGSPTAR